MTRTELDQLLTKEFGLVPEPVQRGDSVSFFVGHIERNPARCTRALRVFFATDGEPARLQLCASSDNNNAVLLQQPFERHALAAAIRNEIGVVRERLEKER